ncbi:carbon-nitrogen hydrolase family protein [Mycobacterium simiae]|uniref:Carbon-nitrogen hydrolase family protein n=1 Tax=Mycobacterium simiae TaxID=1784 RepID=A0A5B1BAF5_MYCSI|nr:carbon-nitrogen hydrolase family protein [Mycobacterium simiae]KAA1244961.1 carbon-nitrogen hydrolase family protein [Mycobacterium simiae]
MPGTTKVAAVQISTTTGQLEQNLSHVRALTEEAVARGAEIIALPEFFTGALAPSVEAFRVALPAGNNAATDFLLEVATTHRKYIGGSLLVAAGNDLFNRYYLATPGGKLHTHDKDLPTMWENCFYIGGHDDGVFATELGGVGAAVCWELIRTRTLARMAGRVQLVITGTHWWDLPSNWPAVPHLLRSAARTNRELSEQAPVEFARHLGVPVIQASHCGTLAGDFYLAAPSNVRLPYRTFFVGKTQIVDGWGRVVAARNTDEGPGVVVGDVPLGRVRTTGSVALPDRFWIPKLPVLHRLYWTHQNWAGKGMYKRLGRRSGLDAAAANAAMGG